MKATELREKSKEDLQKELVALRRELFNLRMQKGAGETPVAHRFKQIRRDVARIFTVLREQQGGNA